MALEHYNYQKKGNYSNTPIKDGDFLRKKTLYTFKSTRSNQVYWVWVEEYSNDFYAVKFHLKAHRHSEYKYSLMTGLNEARPVINTCIAIMLEIARQNPKSSFGFIGANMQGETESDTKRFRVYSKIMATYFGEEVFEHYVLIEKSAYALVRKTQIEDMPNIIQLLNESFYAMYDYFD